MLVMLTLLGGREDEVVNLSVLVLVCCFVY